LAPGQLKALTRQFYRSFGENFIELFLLPRMDRKYIDRYVQIVGQEYISEGLKRKKGIIFLGVHEGSWELSNVISAYLGLDFSLFFRQQRFPRLDSLLNSYRSQRGARIIQKQGQLRQLIQVMRSNQTIGMTIDQGGKTGVAVKFFSQSASMSSGAVKLALKYDITLLPTFYMRIKGPYIKIIFHPPFEIERSQDFQKDIANNLGRLLTIFEKQILEYPHEYLWSYKIWKYTREKKILILSDAKTGHLRQSQALAKIAQDCFRENGLTADIRVVEVNFKSKLGSLALTLSSCLSGKYHCQGCLWCLRQFIKGDSYRDLTSNKADVIISCGSRLAPVNYIIARENLAKSLAIMRPSLLSSKRFDLVVMARHDRPAKRKNIVQTEGALNLVDDDYLKSQLVDFKPQIKIENNLVIGVLFGGNTKNFFLSVGLAKTVIGQIKQAAELLDANLLITTSRRTTPEIERLFKDEFRDYPTCKRLIIANQENIPQAVGGILAYSNILVVSPESISMISEAVNSKKYVVVFNSPELDLKHRKFLNNFAQNKYLYLADPEKLSKMIQNTWLAKPGIKVSLDLPVVKDALRKVL
jgi:lauroyl/myristoyl acyltransferase/mitochondrial fission protein ELM1